MPCPVCYPPLLHLKDPGHISQTGAEGPPATWCLGEESRKEKSRRRASDQEPWVGGQQVHKLDCWSEGLLITIGLSNSCEGNYLVQPGEPASPLRPGVIYEVIPS